MAEFPALPLWTDAYLGDTTHLTTIEHGAYLLLLITAWRTRDCVLPDDDRLLARYARLNAQQWKRMRPIIAPFFTVRDGIWKQGRLTDERGAVERHRTQQSVKGKAGAEAKALKRLARAEAAASSGLPPAQAQVQPDASSLTLTHTHVPLDEESNGLKSDPEAEFWANAKAYLKRHMKGDPGSLIAKWLREQGKETTVAAINAAQLEHAVNPKEYIPGYFRRHGKVQTYDRDRITV